MVNGPLPAAWLAPAGENGLKAASAGDQSGGNLESLLDKLEGAAGESEEITIRDIRNAIGRRSFAPLLLAASIIGFTPLGGVPGIPTTLAIIIVAIAGQMLAGQTSLWLPDIILRRTISCEKLKKAVSKLRPVARTIDKVIRPRLAWLTERPASYVIAFACILLAFTVPPFEFIPFIDIPLWGAIVAFSLALVAHDGLLAIIAFGLTATGLVLAVKAFL
jgi:hypothetical protein